jgi:hypothetical protein
MNFLKSALLIGGVGLLGATAAIYFGVVHPGADEPHSAQKIDGAWRIFHIHWSSARRTKAVTP